MKEIIKVDGKVVAEFLNENIFSRFGVPREIVIDQGSKFIFNIIENLMRMNYIRNKQSTPYHPQANGQVEVTNRELERILTKIVLETRKILSQ